MPKFTFTCEHPSFIKKGETLSKITFESNRDSLEDVLEDIQDFLKGCGYTFNGTLDIREDEEPITMDFSTMNDQYIVGGYGSDVITFGNSDDLIIGGKYGG